MNARRFISVPHGLATSGLIKPQHNASAHEEDGAIGWKWGFAGLRTVKQAYHKPAADEEEIAAEREFERALGQRMGDANAKRRGQKGGRHDQNVPISET